MTRWELERKARQKASSIAGRYGLVVPSIHCSGNVPSTTYRIETVVPGTGCRLTIIEFAWKRILRDGHPQNTNTAGSTTGFDGCGASRAVPVRESSVTRGTTTGES